MTTPAPSAPVAADVVAGDARVAPATADATADTPAVPGKARLRGRRRAEAEGAPESSVSGAAAAPDSAAAVVPASSGGVAAASAKAAPQRVQRLAAQIPQSLLDDPALAQAISVLPRNYNFELYKSIWRLRESRATTVGLQFPEGLLMYACVISDILRQFVPSLENTVIMGDVTYGACCVDDYTARALGCDFMIHYGHSCLVPIDVSTIHMLYVFVDILIDVDHLVRSLRAHFPPDRHMVLAGTIQFATALAHAAGELAPVYPHLLVPQSRPLSKGEVLGCTSPRLPSDIDTVIFVADGRFHLESLMIHNEHVREFFKYDPYAKRLTREAYAHGDMHSIRQSAIAQASRAKKWGLILGTLGRQGNMNILTRLQGLLKERNIPFVIVLLSEIFPDKLARFKDIEAWVQVACPRLSIDWGYAFHTPLLSSYEAEVALSSAQWQTVYPMDYYADAGGSWSNYHADNTQRAAAIAAGGGGKAKAINPVKARKEAKAAAAAAAAAKARVEIAYAEEEAPAAS